jgi:peptide/nickel transport system permease protein
VVAFIIRRLAIGIFTMFIILALAFLAIRLTPGNPAQTLLGQYATPQSIAAMNRKLGLNHSIVVQFWRYVSQLARGDLGDSISTQGPVTVQLKALFPYTLQLTVASVVIALCIGLPIGTAAAMRRGSAIDAGARLYSLVWFAVPDFWLGLMLLFLFAGKLGWFPLFGAGDNGPLDDIKYLALPALTIGLGQSAVVARMFRSALLETLSADYVRTAYAKGVPRRRVVLHHIYRNALNSIISVTMINTIALLSGSIVAETVFSRPGVGRLLVTAVGDKDYPMIQGCILLFAACVVVLSLAADILSATLDPRIMQGGAR